MTKKEAKQKAMQIIAMRKLDKSKLILKSGLRQIIPNSNLFYSDDSDKIYTIHDNTIYAVEVLI